MTYVDLKYINILSGRLSLFKRKTNNLFNFRCPFCGDSQKNKLKARGYIYAKESKYSFKCHNCGTTSSIGNLIKHVDANLFKEYRTESFLDTNRSLLRRRLLNQKELYSIKENITLTHHLKN